MVAARLVHSIFYLAILATYCQVCVAATQDTNTTPGRQATAAEPVDIANFARVVTSDPKRVKGTTATRLEEMPAEDVFLETGVKPASDGTYVVPVTADDLGCIGLRWNEPRLLRRLELHWADRTRRPSPDRMQLQYWVGQSPWQGEWKTLSARSELSGNTWKWWITQESSPERTLRVRWIFSSVTRPLAVKDISAFGRLPWLTTRLRLEVRPVEPDERGRLAVYNGGLLTPSGQIAPSSRQWDLSQPLTITVRYSKPAPIKAERTVLRLKLPKRAVSVAVEDVVERGCVYVPTADLFVVSESSGMTPGEYLREIAGKETVLEEVRRRPDRRLADAMAAVHNPQQNLGPTLVSLACDNRKFVAQRDGTIRFRMFDAPDAKYRSLISYRKYKPHYSPHPQLVPRFGNGKGRLTRHLDGGWLPKPTITVTESGVKYRECVYVAPVDAAAPEGSPSWYRNRAVCVADFTIENSLSTAKEVELRVGLRMSRNKSLPLDGFRRIGNFLVAVKDERVLALFETTEPGPLSTSKQGETVVLKGRLPAGQQARLVAYLPAWPVKPAEFADLASADRWAAGTAQYWNDVLAGAMRVDVPDRFLSNVIRASQVHCLIAARNEEQGRYVAPWIDSMLYGPLDSEAQAVIHGMDLCGHTDFAQRGLEFFLKRYNSHGYMTTGYTKIGAGEHLWTLAEHYRRHPDPKWLRQAAPTLVRAGKWIATQRTKTKHYDVNGDKAPEYGLMPPDATADCGRFCHRFFNEAQYYYGLLAVAQILNDIRHPDAPALLADAKSYREDILRAYRWTEARSPVTSLRDGTWIPNPPADLNLLGNIEDMLVVCGPDKMFIYNAEIGPNHLVTDGVLAPDSREADEIINYLEDHQFLRSGHHDYSEQKNRGDPFAFGGFGKVQPYYGRNAEVCAMRDDVKPFIRSYFNAMSSLIGAENLTFWEHFRNTGGWNKTHETGWFLAQTSVMLARERDGELWLAPMITNQWLKDGMAVAVRNAPTRFGNVSYRITSHAGNGHIDAHIQPPTRRPPKHIVIRIRHPEEKPIRAVTVNGRPHSDFDVQRQCVRIAPTKRPVKVQVQY